ncbi:MULTISPECIES: DnaB-like helicase C-terminal domain-containing protein [unclassified Rhizobium]|uniref:replicative DNA helicase n=1 Tax=unclassified Rhizobium TaxID=2613769 RepID=UPI00288A866B|nr:MULTISPECIES: DnaB-like helicase C-terminal domain-containing protein [unclassified Rhizobium]
MNAMNQDFTPANIEAEQALLGGIMVNNDALLQVPATFEVFHFFERIHRDIYSAMLKCREASKNANPVTIRSFMSPESAAQKIGEMSLPQYLAALSGNAVSVVNVPDYADAVTEYYHRREAMAAGEEAGIAATRAADELEFIDRIRDCRDRFSAIITGIETRNEPQESFNDAVDRTFETTGDAIAGRRVSGLDLGIPELTNLMGPLGQGELLVIGGDVKTGKSAAAWQCFFNLAERHPIAGVSGEMPREQVIMREKARRTGISAKRQKRGHVSQEEMDELLQAGQAIKRLKFIDIISKQITLDEVDERINRLQGEFGIEAFVLDHILKLAWTGKMEDADDFKKANKATSTLKNIAMKRKIPIIALTHINKNSNDGTWGKTYRDRLMAAKRRRPTYKSMLGNIDKDVDNMIIVHQAYPAVAGMEPEEGTDDYILWESTLAEVKGKAEFILALSRENEFPRRQEIAWRGESTSFGQEFRKAQNDRRLL